MHTNRSGIRTRWAAVGAAVAITLGAAGIGGLNIASADVASGDRPVYIPINPCRLMDTRAATAVGPKTSPLGAGETTTVTAHGSNGECTGASAIPTDALSLSLNVTAVGPTANTFLTFWGDGPNPGTSNLNPRAGGAPTPNSVNTPLSTSGTFNIFNNRGFVDVIVDVNGFYANHNHDDRYAHLDHDHDDYVTKPTELIIDGYALRPDGEPSDWDYRVGWDHTVSTGGDCLVADVNLPIGATITSAELIYGADGPAFVETGLVSVASGPESAGGDLRVAHAGYEADVPPTPPMAAGIQALTLTPDSTEIPAGYATELFLCAGDEMVVASVRITYTNL